MFGLTRSLLAVIIGCWLLALPAYAASNSVEAVKAAVKNDFARAFSLARKSGDPVTLKTIEWYYLRARPEEAGYQRIIGFARNNPHWPLHDTQIGNAEQILAKRSTPAGPIKSHFTVHAPVSVYGHIAQARHAFVSGDRAGARRHILKAWLNPKLSLAQQKQIEDRFKQVLKKSDYEKRLWVLIHAQKTKSALGFAKKISRSHVKAATAARQLIRVQPAGVKSYQALPKKLRNSRALQYAYARYLRKRGKHKSARNILLRLPQAHADQVDPKQWWVEKRLNIRNVLTPGNRAAYPDLYKLAASHGFSSGKEYIEGEFLAGWLALRKLGNAKRAQPHFQNITVQAKTRTDKTRGYYWLGRALEAKGDRAGAKAAYNSAAASPTLYYGLLAREKLGLHKKPIPIATGNPDANARQSVNNDELVRAFMLLAEARQHSRLSSFVWPIARRFNSQNQHAAAAAIVRKHGGISMSVRYAKAAGRFGYDIDDWGYPVNALPDWKRIGPKVEKPLVYGLSRQESEFHPGARSSASAQGLMQLLPSTAKLIAKQYRVKYARSKLTNPQYNVMLGAAHLGDLVNKFNGSYVLTFVGYNAGPRRSTDWIAKYGDLRRSDVDAIDWVEQIPFTETRKYVQKVLQNIHVYRSRFGNRMIGMSADLNRGSGGGSQRQAHNETPSGDQTCGARAQSLKSLIEAC